MAVLYYLYIGKVGHWYHRLSEHTSVVHSTTVTQGVGPKDQTNCAMVFSSQAGKIGMRCQWSHGPHYGNGYGAVARKAQRKACTALYDISAIQSGGEWIGEKTIAEFIRTRPDCAWLGSLLGETTTGERNAFDGMRALARAVGEFRRPDGISRFGDYRAAWEFIQDNRKRSRRGRSVAKRAQKLSALMRYALVPQRVNLSAFARDDPLRAWFSERISYD